MRGDRNDGSICSPFMNCGVSSLIRRAARLLGGLLAITSLALAAGCGGGAGLSWSNSDSSPALSDNQDAKGQKRAAAVKVALLLPLSSPNARGVAKALKQAGELALFDFDNPNVQLSPKDTRGTPEGARAAAQEAIRDGAELIIGPLFSAEVAAVAPEAQRANVPVLAFSSDQKVAGNGVYLMSVLAGSDVDRIVAYAASRGKQRFAALIPDSEYGRIVENSFKQAADRHHIQVVATQKYPADANGMTAPVKEIAALASRKTPPSQIDALFVPAQQDTLPALSPLLANNDVDTQNVKLLGVTGWDYTGVGREKALAGAWFAAPDPKGWKDFTKRYSETYGEAPPRLASLSYDAVSLAVSLSTNPAGKRFTTAELTKSSGFAGVDGLFRLRPDGVSERRFAILEVQQSGAEVADPAPANFSTAAQF
jgi:branched-chain amino acid transport system substrate-binding protein